MNAALTETIKRKARELGFDKVGVARAAPLEEGSARLREWLFRGYHGTMGWMEKDVARRTAPARVLPGAASLVMVAMNYFVDVPHEDAEGKGKISRYAWGSDYHDILLRRLKRLLGFIVELEPEARGKVYVDTGPVMEKSWAVRSGIGWLGKHTNVITREFGSWVFLGEIILSVDLVPDDPAVDQCGTCTLCIEACPTGAIVEPYVLDATRCISYLTIEHRGQVAAELGKKFDGWIYGCDICQDVCPWDLKFARPTSLGGFAPRQGNSSPDLAEIRAMSPEEFSVKFRESPVKRAHLAGLVRNADIVLSNQRHSQPGQQES